MKKLINKPADYVDEALDGLVLRVFRLPQDRPRQPRDCAHRRPGGRQSRRHHGRRIRPSAGVRGLRRRRACSTPARWATCSRVRRSDICADALRAADGKAGVLCVLGNYGGDRMSFAQACDEFADEGGTTADGHRRRRRRQRSGERSRQAARCRGHGVRVQGRRRQRRARRPSRHALPASRGARPNARARSASRFRRASFPARRSRDFRCPKARSRSGWESTASPAWKSAPSPPRTR